MKTSTQTARGFAGTRSGFTLIEMLVVISIIIVLAGLMLLFNPKTEKRLAAQGADQLQTYLASARSRALRDNVPSGVRLLPDSSGNFREFQFVQSPEPFNPAIPNSTPPSRMTITPSGTLANPTSTATFSNCLSLSGAVQPGDMLEIVSGSGSIHRVLNVFSVSSPGDSVMMPSSPAIDNIAFTSGFRFIRQPRPLMGEQTLQMPNYVRVDAPNSQNLNALTSYQGSTEIIFAPSGQVINATQGRIVLWVSDDNGVSSPTLLTIYSRTGGVAAHPVNTNTALGDAYQFTRDGNSSGQ